MRSMVRAVDAAVRDIPARDAREAEAVAEAAAAEIERVLGWLEAELGVVAVRPPSPVGPRGLV